MNARNCWSIWSTALLAVTSIVEIGALPPPVEAESLSLKVTLMPISQTNLILNLRLTNKGSGVVFVPLGHLPWNRYAMTLIIIGTDPLSSMVKQQFSIADPPPGEPHRLRPGEEIEGRIDLIERYPALMQRHKNEDMLIFWSYKNPFHDESKRLGGWLLIPRFSGGDTLED